MPQPSRIDRVREFREQVNHEKGIMPALSISIEYVDQYIWNPGNPINWEALKFYEEKRAQTLKSRERAEKSYSLLCEVVAQSHKDQHGRTVIPETLMEMIKTHLS